MAWKTWGAEGFGRELLEHLHLVLAVGVAAVEVDKAVVLKAQAERAGVFVGAAVEGVEHGEFEPLDVEVVAGAERLVVPALDEADALLEDGDAAGVVVVVVGEDEVVDGVEAV